jgi:hypothetical protein
MQFGNTNESKPSKSKGRGTSPNIRGLGGRAAQITEELRNLHWDNCKVNFDRAMAYRFAFGAVRDGHAAEKIVRSYERALHECHALATDRTASRGYVFRFDLSSTVSRARKFLASDGLSRTERMRRWYGSRRAQTH